MAIKVVVVLLSTPALAPHSPVPTYFFDVDDGEVHTGDKVGIELPDITAATIEAGARAGELLKDRPRDFWNTQDVCGACDPKAGVGTAIRGPLLTHWRHKRSLVR